MPKQLLATLAALLTAAVLNWPLVAGAQGTAAKSPSPAQAAARDRLQKCSAEWKEAKSGGKLAAGAKWTSFWSECNGRLKGKAAT
jgi:hypothetical protein